MDNRTLALDDFLQRAGNHRIKVVQDYGVYRHLQFRAPVTRVDWFDIVTWPGSLCISGDMGTYVFRYSLDMFKLFRMPDDEALSQDSIDPRYWGEKLQAYGADSGYKEFSWREFSRRVNDHVDEYVESSGISAEQEEYLRNAVSELVLDEPLEALSESEAYESVDQFQWGDFRFVDFFDGCRPREYTFHYLWSLYAVVWGIREYDNDVKWRNTFNPA